MPNQLYGRVEQKTDGAEQAKDLAGKATQLGLGPSSLAGAGSQQQANSPYANFEDIFNKNTNIANQSANKTVGKVADPLQGLPGRGEQTLAPPGQAQQLNLPGFQGLGDSAPPGNVAIQANTQPAGQAQTQQTLQQTQDSVLNGFAGGAQAQPAPSVVPAAPGGEAAYGTRPVADPVGLAEPRSPEDVRIDELDAQIGKVNQENQAKAAQEDDWLKRYMTADEQLDSYKSDEGLALMQKDDPGASIWDAGLMNQAGGRDAFAELEKNFQNYDQDYMKQVVGDRQKRGADYNDLLQRYTDALRAKQEKANPGSTTQPTQTKQENQLGGPKDYTALDKYLFGSEGWGEHETSGDKVMAELHRAGLTMSPADVALIGIGEAGTDTPLATEEFVKAFMGGIVNEAGQNVVWQKAKLRMAISQIIYEYGAQAANTFIGALIDFPEIAQTYLAMHNPGFMARNIRQWLEGSGWQKQRSSTSAQWENLFGGKQPDSVKA